MKLRFNAMRMLRDGAFEARAVCGCILIVLTALLTAVSPWTEYYWNFDHFLHGGQDLEFGLLATIAVFCLVLVLMQQGKESVSLLLSLWRWLSILFQNLKTTLSQLFFRLLAAFYVVSPPDPAVGIFNLPLRI